MSLIDQSSTRSSKHCLGSPYQSYDTTTASQRLLAHGAVTWYAQQKGANSWGSILTSPDVCNCQVLLGKTRQNSCVDWVCFSEHEIEMRSTCRLSGIRSWLWSWTHRSYWFLFLGYRKSISFNMPRKSFGIPEVKAYKRKYYKKTIKRYTWHDYRCFETLRCVVDRLLYDRALGRRQPRRVF